ncbi:hypothetical protein KKC91_01140 [bacterium]|nr:hypothetical protein [bacterium]
MRDKVELPVGTQPEPLGFPHFPTLHQAVIWRNWELVSANRLAQVLKTSEQNVMKSAQDMGLRIPPVVGRHWLQRGYITIIRNNWHLLSYEQLLILLGWKAEKLVYTLKEDDFLWHKLGSLKPHSKPVYYRSLTSEEIQRTAEIKKIVEKHFPNIKIEDKESPFDFLATFQKPMKQIHKRSVVRQDMHLIYSYFGVYGDPLLDRTLEPYPDGLLQRYSDLGVNGVWLQGILYTLFPWKAAPELSVGYEKRLENLRKLTERTANFGIGVYLYLNEPRPMPLKFFKKHPELKGVEFKKDGIANLCTSQKPVLDFLRKGTAKLFQDVPKLAGVFTITRSENPTNCWSHNRGGECPRCSKRYPQEVITDVNWAIEEGVHSTKPEARVIVWTWGWNQQWAHAAIDLLPDNVELMCTSEEALPTDVGGIKSNVRDYSISQVGPGERAIEMWKHAIKRGLKAVAKVQINNTWECSEVPYIPTPDLVEKHLKNLHNAGVTGLMLSWTVGGYPSGNLELLTKTSKEMALDKFGEKAALLVRKAWHAFSDAFKEFPFDIKVLYFAPQNFGPMSLFYAKPTGYQSTMIGYPYDNLEKWRADYPADIFENQFKKISNKWEKGLEILDLAKTKVDKDKLNNFTELEHVAISAYCHFRSTYLQIRFVRLRDCKNDKENLKLIEIIDEEIKIAKTLYNIVRLDSRIGFEASNHYYYTVNDLREKVLNCEYLKEV